MNDREKISDRTVRGRVLVVTHLFPTHPSDISGPWVAEQVDALHKLVDLEVLCCSEVGRTGYETRPSGVPVTFSSIRPITGHNRIGLVEASFRYDRALRRFLDADDAIGLLHAHFGIPDAVVVGRHARRLGLPFVVTLHGSDAIKVLPRRDPIGAVLRRAVQGAQGVICVSSTMADAVRRTLPGVAPTVIPNGFDDRLFTLSTRPRDLGLLFVGTLLPVKNLDLLLRAYARAYPRLGVPLTIAGDGPLRRDLEALAAELGIAAGVRFTGALVRGEVAALMGSAKALVLPSRSEGWPLVVAEALGRGTPVVASRVGGIPEIVGDRAGILVSPGDLEALASALLEAVARSWDPAVVAAASRAQPWSVQARRIADVYGEILGKRSSG